MKVRVGARQSSRASSRKNFSKKVIKTVDKTNASCYDIKVATKRTRRPLKTE